MDKRWLNSLDKTLIITVFLLVLFGILLIYSATHTLDSRYWIKQCLWLVIGIVMMVVFSTIDYKVIITHSYYIYFFTIFLLLVLLIYGKTQMGSQRWFSIGPVFFQPSEIAKLSILLVLIRYLHDNKGKVSATRGLFVSLLLTFLPMILIVKQPDLGTALLFIPLIIVMLHIIGLKVKYILTLIISAVASFPLFWLILKDYQKQRIFAFFNPYADPLGSGYTVIQSKIAIGSGGIFGKGFLHGTQSQLKFIPVNHTDFIFSVLAEEFGFIGVVILLFLYFVIVFQSIKIAMNARDFLGTLIGLGCVSLLVFQIVINIAVASGMLPVTGLPLPFISYGGSSLIVSMIIIGILLNIKYVTYKFIA